MNEVAQGIEGNVAIPKRGHGPKQANDGFVRIGVDVVFHPDVLKPPLPKGDASDGAPGTNTREQMSLDLEDL